MFKNKILIAAYRIEARIMHTIKKGTPPMSELTPPIVLAHANRLTAALVELHTAKTTTQKKHERPTRPTFGPTPPGQATPIELDHTLAGEIRSWCQQLRKDHQLPALPATTNPTFYLARWMGKQATAIAEDIEGETIIEEMGRWTNQINRALHLQPSHQTEQRHTAAGIQRSLSKAGYELTPQTLRLWAHRGHITSKINQEGKATYLISEVAEYMQAKQETLAN